MSKKKSKDRVEKYNTDIVAPSVKANVTDILMGTSKNESLRGGAGDDILTGGSTSSDTFIYERSVSKNGIDTITDFNVFTRGSGHREGGAPSDLIDLTSIFGKNIKITDRNIDQYVRLHNNQLQVDIDGSRGQSVWQTITVFDNNGSAQGGGYINDGDLIRIKTKNFDGKIAATNDGGNGDGDNGGGLGDTISPTITSSQSLSYQENQTSGSTIGTVAANDDTGVINFRFTDSQGSTSQDGFYSISSSGVLTITELGVAAGANNDFETTPNDFTYGIEAGDAAGNWSVSTSVTFNVTNDTNDDVIDPVVSEPGFSGTFRVLFPLESPITAPTKATFLPADELARIYNYVPGFEDAFFPDDPTTPEVNEQFYGGTSQPYFLLGAALDWTGTPLPGYLPSDLIKVSLFETTANRSFDADLFILIDPTQGPNFENLDLQSSWRQGNGLDVANIGVGDIMTVTFVGVPPVDYTLSWPII